MRALVMAMAIVVGAGGSGDAAPAPDEAPLAAARAVASAREDGAALIADGEALGKAGRYELALARFRAAAQQFPSATHDCYVALTYFRLGALTAARLYLDAAPGRGDEVPGWCGGRLAEQLAAELARRGYVPVDIEVSPRDGVVQVGEVRVVGGRRAWLPPGPVAVSAERDGYQRATVDAVLPVVAPAGGVAIAVRLDRIPTRVRTRRPWLAYATVAAGVALVGGGVGFHAAAVEQRDAANRYYADDPQFALHDRAFVRDRAFALGGYVGGAALVAAGVYLVARARRAPPVEVAVARDRIVATWTVGGW